MLVPSPVFVFFVAMPLVLGNISLIRSTLVLLTSVTCFHMIWSYFLKFPEVNEIGRFEIRNRSFFNSNF
jgi:hypothetical protein